jgi:hypothetical protein
MLSARLVRMIEDHAEQLTHGLIRDLHSHPRTPSYHHLSHEDLHGRVYNVYRNLGHWLGRKSDEELEAAYQELGEKRAAEGIPLHEVVYALILTKYHLRDYIRSTGLVDSAVELYQEQELHRLVGNFFDLAMFYTVKGYQRESARGQVAKAPAPAHRG